MHSHRLVLLLTAAIGAAVLKLTSWVCKTTYSGGEAQWKSIEAPEFILGRQAHLILLAIGLLALLAPGVRDGRLTNRLSDGLSRLGKMLAAGLAVALIGTCFLSKQIHADDPEALLSSYVFEAEGEIDAAQRTVDNAQASLDALSQLAAANDSLDSEAKLNAIKESLQKDIDSSQPELDRIMTEMENLAEDDEAGGLALMEAYDQAAGKRAIFENALYALDVPIEAPSPVADDTGSGEASNPIPEATESRADLQLSAAQASLEQAKSTAAEGVAAAEAAAEQMRTFTPETFPDFEGQSYLSAGLSHLIGIVLGVALLLGLALAPARVFSGATEQRWSVASLALLTSVAATGASQVAQVGPMLIGVPATTNPFGKVALALGIVVFAAVLFVRRDRAFGWIDGLAFTAMLGATALFNLLQVVDNSLANTEMPLSQGLIICLPMMAIVLMWPLGQKPKDTENSAA